MPKCISCNEVYADQLRRCPHCGYTADPAAGDAHARGASAPPSKSRRVVRYAAIATVSAAAALGAVLSWPATPFAPPDDLMPLRPRAGAEDESEPVTLSKPKEIEPDPVDRNFQVTDARIEDCRVFVAGTCSERATAEVRVNGRRATILRDGNRFLARVPDEGDTVEVVAFGIRGDRASLKKEILRGEEGEAERLRLVSHADGATVHTASVRVTCAPWSGAGPERAAEVLLPNVENRFLVDRSSFVLYRAPEGYTYLRTTSNGVRTFLREIDDQEMVLVPGGVSWRGMGTTEPHGPRHLVELTSFLIDRSEVTCGQYSRFLAAERRGLDVRRHPEDMGVNFRPMGWTSDEPPEGMRDLPVTGIPWYAAWSYARWVGGRLPTETEWERASAGPMGLPYPWGDLFNPARCCAGAAGPMEADSLVEGSGFFDLLHASGNVREWCLDRFDPRWYMRGGRSNPRGPAHNTHRVVRGGSYASPPEALRLQARDHGDATKRFPDVGFRVARPWDTAASPDGD